MSIIVRNIDSEDIHSGVNVIDSNFTIASNKEMVVSYLLIDETITIDGILTIFA